MFEVLYDHFYEFIGAYMFLALALMLFTGLPVAFALGGVAVSFGLLGIWLDVLDFAVFFQVVQRIWGGDGASGAIQNPILVAIPCFVFMGTMLERSRVAEDLLHILQVLFRRVPGALALAVTVMGTIMAATTGIIGASVVMMTLMALPTMISQKYDRSLATGTLAASATLGILIPPSIMLVLMGSLLAVSVGNLFVGAIFPGLILSGLYVIYIVAIGIISPDKAPAIAEDAIQMEPSNKKNILKFFGYSVAAMAFCYIMAASHLADVFNWGLIGFLMVFAISMVIGRIEGDSYLGGILKGFVPPIFLITLVLGSIFAGWATPTEAAGVGAFGSLILAFANRTLNMDVLRDVVHRTGLTTAMIFLIFVGATAFSTIFRNVYGEDLIIDFIEWLELGPWPLLFMLMFVVFILGFFFDWLEITLIILPVFAPVIQTMAPEFAPHLGLDVPTNNAQIEFVQQQVLYWFAIIVAINLQTSFLTPPFGFALFYMKGVAKEMVSMQQIYRGIIPFVVLQLIGLGIVVAIPEITLWLPSVLLQ